ncbi:troponin I4a [Sardina pilchardus]|uniref:troponin I4a n=1 Tax=Sardina pilchardus TaxID=27697 RepID=UPI002E0D965D
MSFPHLPHLQKKPKYSATRRLLLKCKILKKGEKLLLQEEEDKVVERENALKQNAPPLKLPGLSVQELQELCKDLHRKIDVVDETRYDLEIKVSRNETEIASLNQKVISLKGKMKRPNLKRVKKTTDDMFGAISDPSKLMKSDFKANLKTVKKEEEKKEEVTDWRKNVEAMSGMEGRKKLFNANQ